MRMQGAFGEEGWTAFFIAGATLPACLVAGLVMPGFHHPVALVVLPVSAAAGWLFRGELRAGGWWSVGSFVVLAIALALVLVPPTYFARMLP